MVNWVDKWFDVKCDAIHKIQYFQNKGWKLVEEKEKEK